MTQKMETAKHGEMSRFKSGEATPDVGNQAAQVVAPMESLSEATSISMEENTHLK